MNEINDFCLIWTPFSMLAIIALMIFIVKMKVKNHVENKRENDLRDLANEYDFKVVTIKPDKVLGDEYIIDD
jgi:hypothetical protein